MDQETTREEPSFRQFRPDDMDACSRLAWNAWAADADMRDEFANPRVMEGYVRTFMVRSNWTEIAYDSSGVIGLLFGRIGRIKNREKPGPLASELGMIPQFIFGVDGQRISPAVIWHFFSTEFKVLVNVPRSDAEVNLIIVESRYQGKGLGKKLMERFIGAARDAGCKSVTLYTDDQASNWRFYEILGFKKVATFHDGLTSFFVERKANGLVYVLDIK